MPFAPEQSFRRSFQKVEQQRNRLRMAYQQCQLGQRDDLGSFPSQESQRWTEQEDLNHQCSAAQYRRHQKGRSPSWVARIQLLEEADPLVRLY